jgi:flagellar biosynthesis regulator FlaF
MMYQFAYSAIIEEPPPPLQLPDNRKIADAIELFDAAGFDTFAPHERLQLLSDFRRLWLSIANDTFHGSRQAGSPGLLELAAAARNVLEDIEIRRFAPPAGDTFIGGEPLL